MATYLATMFASDRDAHDTYEFDAKDGLFDESRMKLIHAFMEYVDHVEITEEDIGYEIQAASKDRERRVITAHGYIRLAHGEIPFVLMIKEK